MAQGIVLLLDRAADRAVRRCWRRLDEAGIPSLTSLSHRRHVPHVSLIVARRVALGHWQDELRRGFFAGPELPLSLGAAEAFADGGWVYLPVEGVDRGAHRRLLAALKDDVEAVWEHYLPDQWIPHCTIAGGLDGDQVAAAVALLGDGEGAPIRATARSAAIIDAQTGDVLPLAVDG
jgi:hypothetical protein